MGQIGAQRLRGYDSYTVTLGDEIRGRRATMGKSVLDVQRDLRIKAAHVEAIENADVAAIPYVGFVTGYVRAYARYLGMDEDDMLRRFCEEAKYRPQAALREERPRALSAAAAMTPQADLDALIAGSRLAAASRAEALAFELGATLRALGSLAVLLGLVGGLSFGAWSILQNIQRVDFALAPGAPGPAVDAPTLPGLESGLIAAAEAAPQVDPEALAAIYAAQEAPPALAPRDGPILDLDPAAVGVYPPPEPAPPTAPPPAQAAPAPHVLEAATGLERAATPEPALAETEAPGVAPADEAGAPGAAPSDAAAAARLAPGEAEPAAGPKGVALVFVDEAWVRVRDAAGRVVHERLMPAGSRWSAPQGAEGLTLRAGNAGGVQVELDGALYGPLGPPGDIVKDVSLEPGAVRDGLPRLERAG